MNGNLAQIISLASYANDYLQNDRMDHNFFEKKCFLYCKSVNFIDSNKADLAYDPNEWFKFLKKDGCQRLKLIFQHGEKNLTNPDHFSAGLINGGGTWFLETLYDDHSRLWSFNWENKYPYAKDKKFFNLVYKRQFKKHQISDLEIKVEPVKKQLGSALWNISEFADKQGFEKWVDFFNNAMDNLYGSEPGVAYPYDDIIPTDNYTLSEKQLIFSAGKAWCFGRQGSWNDINFKDKRSTEQYLKLSAQLYDEIINSVLAIANKNRADSIV